MRGEVMDVVCTRQFKAGKYFILSGDIYQAIWSKNDKEVNVSMWGSEIAIILKKEFQKYSMEWKG